ncbi:MAG: glycoside-pentoside-hexuronide (GPH):cation symporter [Clostridia bacterium]|nr:glycoside-pentoside-hexuronide (GPH):cation symporter [Clostridia bacterium]MDD3971989.1 glycoside-pentoside-hexuronide (GPH):cation symporter [Clostridia bacterium]MDD4543229.1 glycoside-pentoside-hexuronide (GPH):cation symporter [Clostridia bacterium]
MKKEVQVDEKGFRKFSIRDSFAYAAGDFGCNMSFALKGTMAIFWTQFMQMDSILYAALLIVVQVWDAINDPLIGSIVDADRRKYKRNKFLTYIFIGSLGLIIGGALCFIPWRNAPEIAKIIIFICGYVIWDAFYTIANVPYGSLLSLISKEPADRASLSAWRSVGAMAGNILPMVILPIIIYDSNNNIVGERVFIAALLMGVLGFIAFQFMLRNTEIRVEETVTLNEKRPKFNVFKAIGNFMRNRPAVGATVAAMGMFLGMQGAATAVVVLFQSYFQNVKILGIVQLFAMLPIFLFTPLARKMVVKYGKKELSVIGSLCSVVACIAMIVLPITPDAKGLIIYVLCLFISSLGLGIYSTVSWAMMGDAIDYNEWKNGVREEGVTYSLHSFFRKLAQGIGPAIALVVMVALGYVEANEGSQTFEVALRMRYLVAGLYTFSAILMYVGLGLIYNLDKKKLTKMNEELDSARSKLETE